MNRVRIAIVVTLALVLAPSVTSAQSEPPEEPANLTEVCAASFPKRLSEARSAIRQHDKYKAEYERAVAWAETHHCRQLTPLEIAIRKLDDPNSFVCDAPKPAWMTRKFNEEHQGYRDYSEWQESAEQNEACVFNDPISLDLAAPPEPSTAPWSSDDTEPVRLAIHQLWTLQQPARLTAVDCYKSTGAKASSCAKTQVTVAELTANIQAEIDHGRALAQAEKAKRDAAKQVVLEAKRAILRKEAARVDAENAKSARDARDTAHRGAQYAPE